jgi:transketolase
VVEHVGPCYLRLGKAGEPEVHKSQIDFKIGKAVLFRDGSDVTLISTGGMLQTAVRVGDALARQGIGARVLSMHTLKPLDTESVLAAARETGALFTLEEHSITGGLGSAVAEVLAESDAAGILFQRIGLPPVFSPHIGTQDYMQRQHGLDPDSIVESVLKLLRTSKVWRAPLATAH